MSDRTLVASATNLLARGFLVVPTDRHSRAGEPVNGLFAVARAIQRVVAFKAPARAVAVIEAGPPLAAWPAQLAAQLGPLPELLRALGLHVVEAPDEVHVVASYARAALERGDDAIIVGVDKRYAQLVGDRLWWYDANKDTRYTSEIVHKRFAVAPPQVAEWLALVGDEDALPGIAGIGAKGATTLLETYGSIDGALAAIDAIKGRLGNALRAGRDDVPRELARARLDTGRPLPAPLDELAYTAPVPAEVNATFDRLGFAELLVADGAQLRVEVRETEAAVAAALAALGAAPITVAALLEDPAPVREALVGVALSAGQGDACYVACASPAWTALVPWLEDGRAPKLGHDLVATRVALRRAGIELAGIVGDSACASHLTQPSNWAPHDLAVIAKHVLGRALPEEDGVRGVGQKRKAWAALPVERAADFAGGAAEASAAIWRALAPGVDPALLAEYLELSSTCVRMELTGLIVDRGELEHAERAFGQLEAELTTPDRGARRPHVQHQLDQAARHGPVRGAEAAGREPHQDRLEHGDRGAREDRARAPDRAARDPLAVAAAAARQLGDRAAPLHRRRWPRPLAVPPGALVLGSPGQHQPRSRPRARAHARDGDDPPRVRGPAGAAADVGRLQPARPLRARAPDEGSGARRAAARARRPASPHRRGRARQAGRRDHPRRATARQGRQLRDVRGPGRERARAAARRSPRSKQAS